MKEFNAQLAENHSIRSFFESKRCLIISPLQMVRVMARKLATNVGISATQIDMVNNFHEAQKLMREKKHQIVIAEYYLGDRVALDMVVNGEAGVDIVQHEGKNKYGLDLLELHQEIYPNRLNSIFTIISDYKSQNVAYKCYEADVELFLGKPLSYEALETGFLKAVDKKLYADDTMKEIENVKAYMAKGDFMMAHQVLGLIKEHNLSSAELNYYEGLIYSREKKYGMAINALRIAYDFDNFHYKSLSLLYDTLFLDGQYTEAYKYGQSLSQNFPINPNRLPTFVKVALANQSYDDVIHFCQIFMELDDKDPAISKQLSAGLIVSGKVLAENGEVERATLNFKKAAEFCQGEKKVILNALEGLLSVKAVKDIGSILGKIYEEKKELDQDYLIIKLKGILIEGSFGEALTMGLDLLNKKIKTPDVYIVCLEASISIGRRKEAVEELFENALKAFPEHRKKFEAILADTV
ncbi:MAG: hypothetical protein JNM93_12715 [Bacteriovoracaceae bacterium]|nr:hypothetical protein [Bacteriovoracaceae bacterium]